MSHERVGAYQNQQRQNLTPREAEAMAFTKAAVLLDEARNNPNDYEAFSQALRFNHLLWTIIQADVTDKANKLPPEIKANVVSLSIFVDKQTGKALADADPKLLDALISINRNMAEGLRINPGKAAGAEEPPAAPTAPSGGLSSGGIHA